MIVGEDRDSWLQKAIYPFVDGATLQSTSRKQRLPTGALLDAQIMTPGVGPVHLAAIDRAGSSAVLSFQQAGEVFATITISSGDVGWVSNQGQNVSLRLGLEFAAVLGWPTGRVIFPARSTTIVPYATALRPSQGVTGFKLPNGQTVTGDILLVAGRGLRFVGQRLDAVGNPYAGRELPVGRPITTLGGTSPTAGGAVEAVFESGAVDGVATESGLSFTVKDGSTVELSVVG